MKTCTNCLISQHESNFHKNKNCANGLHPKCKDCRKQLEHNYRHIRRVSPKYRWQTAQLHAKRYNRDFTLTLEQYSNIISKSCYYCNNMLHEKSKWGIGIDRYDNSMGYHFYNCVSCCKYCNGIKNDKYTGQEFKIIVQQIIAKKSSEAV